MEEKEILTAEQARKITNSYSKNEHLKRWQKIIMYAIRNSAEKNHSYCIFSYCEYPDNPDPLVKAFGKNYVKRTLQEWLERLGYQITEKDLTGWYSEKTTVKRVLFSFDIRW